ILEDSRIDWQLERLYPGLRQQLAVQKAQAAGLAVTAGSRRFRLLCYMTSVGLDAPEPAWLKQEESEAAAMIDTAMARLREPDASLEDSIQALMHLYPLVSENEDTAPMPEEELTDQQAKELAEELPPPVSFRGQLSADRVEASLRIDALVEEIKTALPDQEEAIAPAGLTSPELLDIDKISAGDVSEGVGLLIDELKRALAALDELTDAEGKGNAKGFPWSGGLALAKQKAETHLYDEWDYELKDYRPSWCTLHEIRDMPEDADYVADALAEHQALARRVKGQLANLKPERPAKVKGRPEGEELDLERSITFLVDRKAGRTPEENIYIQRRHKERDVSTLFLLDMSASTDDIVAGGDPEPAPPSDDDSDETLRSYFKARRDFEASARRIIDLEKEAVILMAEALETLGDNYSVCGFSGYGRDRVEYYLCKDFGQPFDHRSRARLGGIKPRRSTRMGPAIRHASKSLLRTGSRIKALIIISDGYPQDHDYGNNRNSRDYGLNDTMKALAEARRQGVLSYCLTVDPAGNDYLRTMCPDSQYMVI
ncbi:MAG: nitric oxide reductase activation protein NorD, partial [Pseudomonadales bacterium]